MCAVWSQTAKDGNCNASSNDHECERRAPSTVVSSSHAPPSSAASVAHFAHRQQQQVLWDLQCAQPPFVSRFAQVLRASSCRGVIGRASSLRDSGTEHLTCGGNSVRSAILVAIDNKKKRTRSIDVSLHELERWEFLAFWVVQSCCSTTHSWNPHPERSRLSAV